MNPHHLLVLSTFFLCAASLSAEDSLRLGSLHEDAPTLICLGFAWEIEGDANRNATAHVEYRKVGTQVWKEALPLLRIGGEHVGRASDWLDHRVPPMLAGSIMDLEEDTPYEVRMTASDPDGVEGESIKTITTRTRAEPQPYKGGTTYHVFPPERKTNWTRNESNNLYKAYYGGLGNLGDFNMVWPRIIQPGDTILVHPGLYRAELNHYTDPTGLVADGTYWLTAKGTPERPITIKASGEGEVIFDGAGADVLFNVMATSHHIFEGITFRNCGIAIFAGQQRVGGATGLTVRNCRFENVRDGIFGLYAGSKDFLISDNIFEGRNNRETLTGWGNESDAFLQSNTAITVQGTGHVVRRNRASWFWQAFHMGTAFPGWESGHAIDIYENDFFMLIDDGIEVDGGVRNIRVLRNRVAQAGSPLSAQPIFGGPAYFIRNLLLLANRSALKFHEAYPAGLVVYHNTILDAPRYLPRGLYTNAHFRNNLVLSAQGKEAVAAFPGRSGTWSSDFNGYGPTIKFRTTPNDPFTPIMDFDRSPPYPLKKYPPESQETVFDSLQAFAAATGQEANSCILEGEILADREGVLAPGSPARDAGIPLPNINEGFVGRAPDLGALESGASPVQYGPRQTPTPAPTTNP